MERKKIFDILDIISNIIVVPVVILALFCGILMFNARNHNGVPSLFGYSAVTIITGSMNTEEHPEFAKGQTVLIKKCNPEDIQIDDVIAFYEYYETVDQEEGSESLSLTYSNSNVELEFQDFIGGTLNEASEDESRVIFHRVVDVREYTAEDGTVYKLFATKGDNNSYTDYFIEDGEQKTAWIREDFVIGKFYAKSGFITNVFNFCSSLLGLIVLVLVPCALILIMTTTSVVEQINSIRKDKNLEREQTIKTEKLYQGEVVGDEIVDADEHHEEENKEPKVEETKDEATEGTTEEKSKTNKTKGKKAKEETKSAGEEKPAEPVEEKQEQPHKKRGRKPKSEEKVDTSIVPDEPEEPKKPAEPVEEKPAEPVKETPIAPAKSSTSSKPAVPPKAPPKKAEGVPAKPSVPPKAPKKAETTENKAPAKPSESVKVSKVASPAKPAVPPKAPAKPQTTASKPAVPPKVPPKKAEGVPAKPSVPPKAPKKAETTENKAPAKPNESVNVSKVASPAKPAVPPKAPAKPQTTASKPAVPPKAPPKKAEGVPAKPSVSPKAPPKMPPKKDA